jgi:hypothetical protein
MIRRTRHDAFTREGRRGLMSRPVDPRDLLTATNAQWEAFVSDRDIDGANEQDSVGVNRRVEADLQVAAGFNVGVAGAVVPPCSPQPLVGAVAA